MYHTNPDDVIWALRGHKRKPNLIVRGLYALGDNLVDFGVMFVNLFNVVYTTLRRLFAFFIGLLIELSTVIVLVGTIIFSVFHSIELLRRGGATGGLEYVGLVMFEVVFISSTAKLTGNLMKRQKPDWYSIAGFALGILFVEWSNISGMAQNWTGWIIGFFAPILLIITEGVLAFQYRETGSQDTARKILENHPHLTERDLLNAIQLYLANRQTDTGRTDIDKVNMMDGQTVDVGETDTDKSVRTKTDGQTTDSNETDTDTHPDRHSVPDGQDQTDKIGQTDMNEENTTDTDKQRDGQSDNEQDGQSDKITDTMTDTDGHPNSDSNSDTFPDTDRQTNTDTVRQTDANPDTRKVSGGQISNDRSGQPDTDKPARTKSNVVPFEKKTKQTDTNSDTHSDIEQAKQIALDYYRKNKRHLSIRKLAEAAGIKKHQAEKIRKELEQELTTVGIRR